MVSWLNARFSFYVIGNNEKTRQQLVKKTNKNQGKTPSFLLHNYIQHGIRVHSSYSTAILIFALFCMPCQLGKAAMALPCTAIKAKKHEQNCATRCGDQTHAQRHRHKKKEPVYTPKGTYEFLHKLLLAIRQQTALPADAVICY